ncbi:tyrosine-type recombinase/integrase [Pseudobacteroides cellulosolvens]|uniref:Integrase family protein n=1 Tax=Pseudobacteroides cellulosolvens ATCC 35603 = DSM 2933 TaxID=398512 RepID=A0A0L6JXM1_9FIRM|nr:tyrosine-type recombinase/integrase [Pseudobacteroides cellulosolvens]KNY30608.1 integrase family protein [Pseudobacteroides cellulosolvens ATCC 35603 = DSM 2933]
MNKKATADQDSSFFWNSASEYLNNELPNIRKKSLNTIDVYRRSLNRYIDFLEKEKSIKRAGICYQDFNKNNLKNYLLFMKDSQRLSEKTCNLQMTAIRALLAYASEEAIDITAIYLNAKAVKGLTVPKNEIEYFEDGQLKTLLAASPVDTKLGRRNRMIMILGYDAGLRVSELINLTVSSLHLDAEVPYVTILGKGSKYRNVPLMSKTIEHLKTYLKEFHPMIKMDTPLFYATTHGVQHYLSDDTMQDLLKKYADASRCTIAMPEKIHFHMLRKTRAMDLYQAGCPLSYIQQILGHESISTTSGFYAFATLKTLADAIEKANPSGSEEKLWKDETVLKQLYRL